MLYNMKFVSTVPIASRPADSSVKRYWEAIFQQAQPLVSASLTLPLLATLAVIYPRAVAYQENNLSSMRRAREGMRRVKVWPLRLALLSSWSAWAAWAR